MSEIRNFIVAPENVGIRIDKFLSNEMPEFSRSEIQKFKISRIDNKSFKLSDKTKADDEFIVEIADKKTDVARDNISTDFDLDILYEDDDKIYQHWVVRPDRGLFIALIKIPTALWFLQKVMRHIVVW